MTKPQILKVRKYIHDKYHVSFSFVRGKFLRSEIYLKAHEVEDVLSTFPWLKCNIFFGKQTFYYGR